MRPCVIVARILTVVRLARPVRPAPLSPCLPAVAVEGESVPTETYCSRCVRKTHEDDLYLDDRACRGCLTAAEARSVIADALESLVEALKVAEAVTPVLIAAAVPSAAEENPLRGEPGPPRIEFTDDDVLQALRKVIRDAAAAKFPSGAVLASAVTRALGGQTTTGRVSSDCARVAQTLRRLADRGLVVRRVHGHGGPHMWTLPASAAGHAVEGGIV